MKTRAVEIALLLLGLGAFLLLTLYQISLPGLHYDEAVEVLPAMQLLLGQPVVTHRDSGIHLGGHLFPIMVMDYIGALNAYLTLPFFAILGINVLAIRLMPVLVGVLTLLLTYRLGRELYNPRVGVVAVLLLAVQPSFVFWSRQGIFVTNITAPIALACVFYAVRWWRGKSARNLYAAAFLCGLGLYAKVLFLWVIGALAVALVVLNVDRWWRALRQRRLIAFPFHLTWRQALLAGLCLLLGIAPLILFNLQTRGTILTLTGNVTSSYYESDNLNLPLNLRVRVQRFRAVLEGSHHLWYLGGNFNDRYWPWILVGALIITVLVVVLRARDEWRRAFFPWMVIGCVIVASTVTVSALWFTHFAILMPWPALAVAMTLDLLPRRGGLDGLHLARLVPGWRDSHSAQRLGLGLALIALVVALLMGTDLRVDRAYHRELTRSGGAGAHSAAIYKLAAYMEKEDIVQPVILDWGIDAQLRILTRGKVQPVEIFGYEWEAGEDFRHRVAEALQNPDNVYVFHSPQETVFQRREAFEAEVAVDGKTVVEEKIIRDQSTIPIFVLVRVEYE
jgi:4-amino-4-deoxy-L-arabinose transferase-like glycosyltransferase